MSSQDFHKRLQRLENNTQQHPISTNSAPQKKPNMRLVALGGGLIGLGGWTIRRANENYEAIKESSGIGGAAFFGLLGIIFFLIGVFLIYRASFNATKQSTNAHETPQQKRVVSTTSRRVTTILGTALGLIACFYMFLVSASRSIETETAGIFYLGGLVIVFFATFLALICGFLGLFIRGYALWRVPYFFLVSSILLFYTMKFLRVDALKWQAFVDYMQ
jgi:hypothetical protein